MYRLYTGCNAQSSLGGDRSKQEDDSKGYLLRESPYCHYAWIGGGGQEGEEEECSLLSSPSPAQCFRNSS